MILDTLSHASHYAAVHPLFNPAFEFLASPDLMMRSLGRVDIKGASLYATLSTQPGKQPAEALLETHRKYIDIHVVLAGEESIGWRAAEECVRVERDYRPENDIAFYADTPSLWLTMKPGVFAVFFPWDAHAPLVGNGSIHKVVLKLAVSLVSQ